MCVMAWGVRDSDMYRVVRVTCVRINYKAYRTVLCDCVKPAYCAKMRVS